MKAKNRVLVTGATGFLGGHLARRLARDPDIEVVGTGRNARFGVELERESVRFAPVDLGDRPGLERLLSGVDTVVHSAALSTAWASRSAYWAANVTGTQNLIEAAAFAGVRRFMHISTPAVLSVEEHQYNLNEETPYPERFTSTYGESKAAAERIVASFSGLETAIVRPKAIYGPGDNALLPRLVEAAKTRRLRIVGDGSTLTHLTHIHDAVEAIVTLISAPAVFGVYHVAGPEPVKLWQLLAELLPQLGYDPPSRQLSIEVAMKAATLYEYLWKTFRVKTEPPLTRYKVAAIAFSQTLDTSRIRDELGFEAEVTPAVGLASILRNEKVCTPSEKDQPRRNTVPVDVEVVNSATVHPPAWAVGQPSLRRTQMPIVGAVVDHPNQGRLVFDPGYGPAVDNSQAVSLLYRLLLRPRVRDIPSREPTGTVIVSHLDPDHAGAVSLLDPDRIVMDVAAWEAFTAGRSPLWRRLTARAMPDDLAAKVWLIDTRRGVVDLFEDGSVLLISLPGHAPGHIGMQVRDRSDQTLLFCGDAAFEVKESGASHPGLTRLLAGPRETAASSRIALITAAAEGVQIIPSHSAEMADLYIPGWR